MLKDWKTRSVSEVQTCAPGACGPGHTLPAPPEAGPLVLAVVLVAGVAAGVEEGALCPAPGGDLALAVLEQSKNSSEYELV